MAGHVETVWKSKVPRLAVAVLIAMGAALSAYPGSAAPTRPGGTPSGAGPVLPQRPVMPQQPILRLCVTSPPVAARSRLGCVAMR